MAETGTFKIRAAVAEDMKFVSNFAILNGWRFGPHDVACAFAFDPSGHFVGELDGKVISHVNMTKYPGHSSFIGCFMVQEEERGKGYGKKTWEEAWKTLDQNLNIGLESVPNMVTKYETFGLRTVWQTYGAFLDFKTIVEKLQSTQPPTGVSVLPIKSVDKEKLYKYDASVFGAPRNKMIEAWIDVPGSLGWAAVDSNGELVGYLEAHHTIIGKGTEHALNIAPFYADSIEIARSLLKTAATDCLSNQAVPVSKFEMLYAHGDDVGRHTAQLLAEVDAKTMPFYTRMYTKGIPEGRQVSKMYAITQPGFD